MHFNHPLAVVDFVLMFGGTAKLRALLALLNRSFSPRGSPGRARVCAYPVPRSSEGFVSQHLPSFGATDEPPL